MIFSETTYSLLLVSASDKFNTEIMRLLPSCDYYPVVVAKNIADAKRRLLEQHFDIIFINAPLPDDFGLQFAMDACSTSSSGVLILVKSELYDDVYSRALSCGVMTLSRPTSAPVITQTLRILCATRERLRRVEEKQATVEDKIEEIRLVNRAKWILIENLHMTEPTAHKYIEKQAMDLRISKRSVAENIISTYS